ncbi:MAG: dihydroorotate dehydrogenase-like protein [Methylomonas sp.]|nr:dihydroorotate dehydrogenase-like protein [Methylomonas sp.]PPD21210.1 MAG: dihydroorotate dehydrogenase [Methylomonas sp.]PPD27683.1 MAG: dihydroorotate dehydrogenase [Methylomonas sp.]PPD38897.1 MAG: dihydroorotate dehydrogenase [Methylomonas sp.]PPD39668.1 MAG: dihydroorotate dehydrogenase [Methylomonas sp.]
MIDLTTDYLGLTLAHPLVPSSSPISRTLDGARRLEDAGASALVLPSLFEEKIDAEMQHMVRFLFGQGTGYGEADSFHPMPGALQSYQEQYLDNLQAIKSALSIPVIASLNGTTSGGWIEYGLALQQAGADALELNVYYLAANADDTSVAVEHRYLEILQALRAKVAIPLVMKLSPQFSSPINFAQRLQAAGADGIVLFNRFYQPDIDLETLQVVPKLELSTPSEALLRIRWAALMHGRINMSLAVTGGFHQTPDIIKALLAGADVVHLCSVLLREGTARIGQMRAELALWLEQHDYASVRQMQGSVSHQHAVDPGAYERANYMHVLDSYTPASGVLW